MSYLQTGRTRLTPEEQIRLAVRILDNRHLSDVYDRAVARQGNRAATLGPLDLARNTLRSGVARLNRAHEIPPAVSGLSADLARMMGDESAEVTVDRYAQIGARPMPTSLVLTSRNTSRYRFGVGFGGTLIGWSERQGRAFVETLTPDCLRPVYASDDPTEPTVIEHYLFREVNGKIQEVTDTYDLTRLSDPVFSSRTGTRGRGTDITDQVLDEDAVTGQWPDAWRFAPTEQYPDGMPFHRIVISGDTRYPFDTLGPIEATLNVCVGWTAWWAGINDAGYPGRHVRGLAPVGMDSDTDNQTTGMDVGPEHITQWQDTDPERPGDHWQDQPGFDPEAIGRSLRGYDLMNMNTMGLAMDFEQTGGEPGEQERKAIETAIRQSYPENRRTDSEILRRVAAMLNRMQIPGVPALSEEPYPVLYREEIAEALHAVLGDDPGTPNSAGRKPEEGADG